MSLRARLLAGMAVVSFVLVAVAFIIARTTEANLVDRVDQQLMSATLQLPPDGALVGGVATSQIGPTSVYAARIQNGVRRAGEEVPLSPTEYNLLRFLLANQGRVLSKPQILDHVWQYDFGGDGGVVETYIGYLRKKVDRVDPRLIQTVRGFGYALREK